MIFLHSPVADGCQVIVWERGYATLDVLARLCETQWIDGIGV